MKVTGELYDVYFMIRKDMAQTNALKNDFMARTGSTKDEANKKYAHMDKLHYKEDMELWDMICEEYKLPRGHHYMLDHFGNVIMLDKLLGA